MKTKWFLLITALCFTVARSADTDLNWRYQLLEGSFLADDCLICGRPSFNIPMRGSFMLRRIEVTPVATRYVIENASFQAGTGYSFTGSGTYQTSGDFVIRQTVTLAGDLATPSGTIKAYFTNDTSVPISRRWPMLSATLNQTNGTFSSTITLTLGAAPLREIWFSTSTNFTRAIKIDNTVSDGDLLSSVGRIVKQNGELQNFPGPTYLNMGLDAVDLLPGGTIAFSTETKGVLSDGDYAYWPSGATFPWSNFMTLVAPGLTTDPGLDALQLDGSSKIYFSTKQDFDSPDGPIGHGDILLVDRAAQTGSIFKKNTDLLALFHPAVVQDYGLDALYVWPNGEIWFSTATDFSDSQFGTVTAGDLLSDAGYVVYRNTDLTEKLQPLGDQPTDFGLDAVAVISDAAVAEGITTADAILDRSIDGVVISWKGGGRVFQLEYAPEITGPWEPVSAIIPDLSFEHSPGVAVSQRGFYRLRQW